ncbi:hypothetical protein ACKKBG_A31020 [Auxenochlorella protothecoides x Auxenochlorella symbiontica]
MNPQTALRGAMQRGEPIMFRITIDRLREDRRQTNHAKSQLALAFCQAPPAQAHAFALALVAECCAVGDWDESMIMCAQWALETLGKRAGADGDADGEGVGEARESLRGEALRSFLCCCADGQLKLALRVGTLFRLDLQAEMTAEERGGMARRLAEACAANAAAAGAVALLRRWPCLQLGEAVPGVLLPRLVAQGLSSLAISWAEELDGDVQTLVLHACIARNHLRSARALVSACRMGAAAQATLEAALVARLLACGAWGPALQRTGGDAGLQRRVLDAMVLAGEAELARETAAGLGLALEDDAALRAAAAERAARHLPLDLPATAVRFVDDAAGLDRVRAWLEGLAVRGARGALVVVGVDAEWQPADADVGLENGGGDGAGEHPISILQLADAERVWVLDMLRLGEREAGTALRALCDPALVKAGCGLADDVAKLAWACPALRNMRSCLDLARLRTFMGPLANKRGMLGLSSAAEAMLGKPLDKGLRMSAWQRRPLTPAQLRYAALDALVSVQIVDAIVRQNPKLGSRRGLHAYVFDAARV